MNAGDLCSMDKAKAYMVPNTNLEATLYVIVGLEKSGANDRAKLEYNRTLQYYKNKAGATDAVIRVLSSAAVESLNCVKADSDRLEYSKASFTFKSVSNNANLINVQTSANPVLLLTDFKVFPDVEFNQKWLTTQYQKLYEGEPVRSLSDD